MKGGSLQAERKFGQGDPRPPLPISAWAQYVLDSFATVEEAVAEMRDAPFRAVWRTVADQKNRVYYYEDSLSPTIVWVDLKRIDFKEGSGVRKLTLHGNLDLGGNQAANFVQTEPFVFLAPN